MSAHTPKSYDFFPGGPTLQLHELEAWCRSRGISAADEAQLAAVFIDRDGLRVGLSNIPKSSAEIDRLRESAAAIARQRDDLLTACEVFSHWHETLEKVLAIAHTDDQDLPPGWQQTLADARSLLNDSKLWRAANAKAGAR